MQLRIEVLLAVAEELQAVLGFPSDHLFTTREFRPMRVQMICSISKLNRGFIMVVSELYINVYKRKQRVYDGSVKVIHKCL